MKTILAVLALSGCLLAADFPLKGHVSAVEQRTESVGEIPITNTYTGQTVTTVTSYRSVQRLTVRIEGRQYAVEGKRALALGDYPVRFTDKRHRRYVEFQLADGKAADYLVTGESELP